MTCALSVSPDVRVPLHWLSFGHLHDVLPHGVRLSLERAEQVATKASCFAPIGEVSPEVLARARSLPYVSPSQPGFRSSASRVKVVFEVSGPRCAGEWKACRVRLASNGQDTSVLETAAQVMVCSTRVPTPPSQRWHTSDGCPAALPARQFSTHSGRACAQKQFCRTIQSLQTETHTSARPGAVPPVANTPNTREALETVEQGSAAMLEDFSNEWRVRDPDQVRKSIDQLGAQLARAVAVNDSEFLGFALLQATAGAWNSRARSFRQTPKPGAQLAWAQDEIRRIYEQMLCGLATRCLAELDMGLCGVRARVLPALKMLDVLTSSGRSGCVRRSSVGPRRVVSSWLRAVREHDCSLLSVHVHIWGTPPLLALTLGPCSVTGCSREAVTTLTQQGSGTLDARCRAHVRLCASCEGHTVHLQRAPSSACETSTSCKRLVGAVVQRNSGRGGKHCRKELLEALRCAVEGCLREVWVKKCPADANGPAGCRCKLHGWGRCSVPDCHRLRAKRGGVVRFCDGRPREFRCEAHTAARCTVPGCHRYAKQATLVADRFGEPGLRCPHHHETLARYRERWRRNERRRRKVAVVNNSAKREVEKCQRVETLQPGTWRELPHEGLPEHWKYVEVMSKSGKLYKRYESPSGPRLSTLKMTLATHAKETGQDISELLRNTKSRRVASHPQEVHVPAVQHVTKTVVPSAAAQRDRIKPGNAALKAKQTRATSLAFKSRFGRVSFWMDGDFLAASHGSGCRVCVLGPSGELHDYSSGLLGRCNSDIAPVLKKLTEVSITCRWVPYENKRDTPRLLHKQGRPRRPKFDHPSVEAQGIASSWTRKGNLIVQGELMSVTCGQGGHTQTFVKGSPGEVLARCITAYTKDTPTITQETKEKLFMQCQAYEAQGLDCLAFAFRLARGLANDRGVQGLIFVALAGIPRASFERHNILKHKI
mmetsp:Transcript_12536/g.34646  ORF Transcript_12536/g.34646 Transcript_12536/m.34646 type:complete len:940 (-) Transcript_12536:255-3074(-)